MSDYKISAVLELKDNLYSGINSSKSSLNKLGEASSVNQAKVKKNFDKMGTVVSKDSMQKGVKNTTNSFDKLGQTSSSTQSEVKKNFNNMGVAVSKATKKMESSVLNVGKKILSLAKYAAVGVRATVSAGMVIGFKAASDMEKYNVMLETSFKGNKDKAKDYMAWANKFANETPFTNDEVMEGTVKLTAYGLDPKKMLGTVGDMAGAMGKSLDQAVEAVADAKNGELERLKEFGLSEPILTAEMEKLGFEDIFDNKGSIRDTGKFTNALMAVMQHKFKGGMVKLSKTFSGLFSTIKDVSTSALANIMGMKNGVVRTGSAFDRVKGYLDKMVTKLNSWVESGAVDKLALQFDSFVGVVSEKANEYIKQIGIMAENGQLSEKWEEMKRTAYDLSDSILDVVDSIVELATQIDKVPWDLIKNVGILAGNTWAGSKLGAIGGTVAGSIVPGVGTVVGATTGATAGAVTGFVKGITEIYFDDSDKKNSNKNTISYSEKINKRALNKEKRDKEYEEMNELKKKSRVKSNLNKNKEIKDKKQGIISQEKNAGNSIINVYGTTINNGLDERKFYENLANLSMTRE